MIFCCSDCSASTEKLEDGWGVVHVSLTQYIDADGDIGISEFMEYLCPAHTRRGQDLIRELKGESDGG